MNIRPIASAPRAFTFKGCKVTTIATPTLDEQDVLELKRLQNIQQDHLASIVPTDRFGLTRLTLINNPDGIHAVDFPTELTSKSSIPFVIHDSSKTALQESTSVFELWPLGDNKALSLEVSAEAKKAIAHLLELVKNFKPKV